jgi:hypothetical protein
VTDDTERTTSGTVTVVSPLQVRSDGAVTSCPAESLNSVAYAVGDRVQLQDRSPRRPLVSGALEVEA